MTVKAYGAHAADKPLEPIAIPRREPGPRDVQIEIAYCGVCHSDLHTVRNDWGNARYPIVPGHEIVGRVKSVGPEVTRFKVGDTVFKYGNDIGKVVAPIKVGEHVHVHNVKTKRWA